MMPVSSIYIAKVNPNHIIMLLRRLAALSVFISLSIVDVRFALPIFEGKTLVLFSLSLVDARAEVILFARFVVLEFLAAPLAVLLCTDESAPSVFSAFRLDSLLRSSVAADAGTEE